MGYRGEDASRTRAAWGRQAPWQAPPGTGPADAGSWGDGSRDDGYDAAGYDADAAGYPADDYGYQPADNGDGYPAYGDSYGGSDRYDRRDEYGDPGAVERTTGYPQSEYGQPGYGQTEYGQPGYGQTEYGQTGYGQQGAPGSGTTGAYGEQQPGGYPSRGGSGGYPAVGSGGYPALPSSFGGYPEQDAGNDWYGGQPAAASGASFADTGTYTLNGRVIDEYGSGPRRVLRDPVRGYPPAGGTGPQPVPRTGQQQRYDDYYEQDGFDAPAGYGGRGYDDYAGYGGGQDDYAGGQDAAYDDGTADDDPYQDRYGEPGGRRGARQKGRAAKEDGTDGRARARRPRRKRPLLLTALSVVGVAIIGAAAYVYVVKPSHAANPNAAGALPTSGAKPSAQRCVQQFGTYCHIETRALDPAPLTVAELFPPVPTNVVNGHVTDSFTLVTSKVNTNCAQAVIGSELITELQKGECNQVLRASYVSGDGKIMGTIGVVNLASTNKAHEAGRVVGQNDFIAPLAASKGVASNLGQGTGVVEAEYKGHYLILTWTKFTNGTTPSTTAQDNQLEQFSNELIAGTVNISLSERMVTGAPATPAASASS